MLEKIDSSHFDWLAWRRGTPMDVWGIPCRTETLVANGPRLREAALGWCRGNAPPCRPKAGSVAIMYEKEGTTFWFHLRAHEAKAIFGI
jgi:hypothetical protein